MLSKHVTLLSKMTDAQSSKCHKRNSHCLTLSDLEYSTNKNQLIKKLILKTSLELAKNAKNYN